MHESTYKYHIKIISQFDDRSPDIIFGLYLILNDMNIKSAIRLAALARRNVCTFSKQPFKKFDRKNSGQKVNSKPEESQHQDQKVNKQKQSKDSQSTKNESSSQSLKPSKQQKDVRQSGFNMFDNKKQDENSSKQSPAADIKKEQQIKSQVSKGFERFNRKKVESDKDVVQTLNVNKAKSVQEEGKKEQRKRGKKIPTIRLQITQEDKKDRTNYNLKKPARPKITSLNQPQPQKEEQIKKNIPEEAPQDDEVSKWKDFDRRVNERKLSNMLINQLRYIRLNLIKHDPQTEQKKQEKEQVQQPSDLKTHLLKLIAAGLGLIFVSSVNLGVKAGKEVDADYLQQVLADNNVQQTWLSQLQMQSNNDQHAKGRNIHKHVYIRQSNGDICYCASNKQFESMWQEMVWQHNHQIDISTPDFYYTSQGQLLDKSSHPPRKVTFGNKVSSKDGNTLGTTKSILSMVLLYYFIKSITQIGKATRGKGKGGGGLGMFQNEKSYRLKEVLKVTFKDVVGMQKSKDEIVEFIDFLKAPEKYSKLGARIPKGALLTGPPGTGKTMIAKACAGQSNVPFFSISGSEFIEMYVGVGAQRVRNLFKEAKQSAPSIIFIDQIDAVGKKRTGGMGGGNDERDTTLNQLLVEMDGFDSTTNVIIFAATNQKEVLDAALTRPGRFDRLIDVQLPDLEGRVQIFQVHLKPLVLDRHIQIQDYAKRLATLTPGFSGADIKNVCNQAAIIAARGNKESISIIDFQLATERIIGGVEKKSQLITEETRRTVAYHECGHGVVSWFLEHSNPLLKLTIIPRSKGALGFAQYLPSEHQMYTKVKLLDEICVILGGRVSQQIFFGKISTGASDDLNKAYQVAKTLLTQYGFGQKLGWLQYDETQYAKEYGKNTQNQIDKEILEIMKICTQRTRNIIKEKKHLIQNLAEQLLKAETIDQVMIEDILGPRPFAMSKQHQQYVSEKKKMSEDIKAEELKKSQVTQNQDPKVSIRRADFIV